MAVLCSNPRETLGPSTAPVPGAVGTSCTHYVDLPGFRNIEVGEEEEESRMTTDHPRTDPCHSCSDNDNQQQDINRRDLALMRSGDHDEHAVNNASQLLELDGFTMESKWTPSSHSIPSTSSDWVVNPAPFTGLSPNFPGAVPARVQGSSSFFPGGQVHQVYQNSPPVLNEETTAGSSWGKIEEQVPQYVENQMQHGFNFSYGAHKDQFATMDEGTLSQWVDVMITEMMEAMPGVPIEQLFTNLTEVLAPCNVQMERVIESRFRFLLGHHVRPPAGPRRTGKRAREKCNNEAEGELDQWGNLKSRNVESPRTSFGKQTNSSPSREELRFARLQNTDNLQLSLEPTDERVDQFALLRGSPKSSIPHHQQQQQRQQQQQQHYNQRPQLPPQPQYRHDCSQDATTVRTSSANFTHDFGAQGHHFPSGYPNTPYMAAQTRRPPPQQAEAVNSASDEEGLQLLALLLQCAEAVSTDNYNEANTILPQLRKLTNSYGTCVQRVVACFAEGMASRQLTSSSSSPGKELINNQRFLSAIQVFKDICPFVKFSHFTANQAIAEAFQGKRTVHIIDIDIMHGVQWPGLFHILAKRPGGPPQVHITGFGTSVESLDATGKRLVDFAASLHIPFKFTAVADRIGNADIASLKPEHGDALAVHGMHHSLYDFTGSETNTLTLIQKLAPTIITVVEQDLRHGGAFLTRLVESLHYYSALFDSLGACYSADSPERHLVEQELLACEIKNILAVRGVPRAGTGEKQFGYWRDELCNAGFKPVSLSGKSAHQAALVLGSYPRGGYTLVEHCGTLKIGWKGLCLFTASAWTCA